MNQVQYGNEKISSRLVYYTGTEVIKAGYCLCYDRTISETPGQAHIRADRVGKPSEENLRFFAGVVAHDGHPRGGPGYVTILEPSLPGRLTHIFTNAECEYGVTRLGLIADSFAAVECTTDTPVVALALETADRSQTPGLVLAQLEAVGSLLYKLVPCITQTQIELEHDIIPADCPTDGVVGSYEYYTQNTQDMNNAELIKELNAVHLDIANILSALKQANIMAGE